MKQANDMVRRSSFTTLACVGVLLMRVYALVIDNITFALIVIASIAAVSAQAQREADVYAALFALRLHGTLASTMMVKDVAVPMPTVSGSAAEWLTQFDDVPAALRLWVSQPVPTQAKPLDVGLLPAGTKMISEQVIRELFAAGIELGWSTFRQRYGSGWLSLSDVLFTPDGLDALVYYEAHCDSLCGETAYLWLHRRTTQGPWSINKRIVRSMS
jgi:hypothetical protein